MPTKPNDCLPSLLQDAAAEIGCSIDYAYEVTSQQRFKIAVRAFRTHRMEATLGTLIEASEFAARTLTEMLPDTPRNKIWVETARIRIAAAKAILSGQASIADQTELRQRLGELEQRAMEPE